MKSILRFSLLILSIICCTTNSFAQEWYEMISQEPVNIKAVKEKAEKYFDSAGRGKHTGYKQYQRWLYNATLNMDKSGVPYTHNHIANELKKFRTNTSNRQQKTTGLNASNAIADADESETYGAYAKPRLGHGSATMNKSYVVSVLHLSQITTCNESSNR